MLRIVIVTASVLLPIAPALADNRNNPAEEDRAVTGSPYATSQALSDAAHNATSSQQGGVITGHIATQMGVSILDAQQ